MSDLFKFNYFIKFNLFYLKYNLEVNDDNI